MKLREWVLFLASISFRNAHGVRQRTPKAKIACVGDSLTAGYPFDSGRGPDASVSGYPYHLQELLADEGYEVRNFGKGETTVVSGSKSYRSGWYNETWQEALRWKPDRVLLMFGANDVKESRLKKFENEFEDAFTQLIQSFLDLDPPPVLALLIPPPMYDNNIYGPEFDPPGRAGGMQQKVYNQQLPLKLQELAERMQVSLIDLHECFLKHESCTDVAVNCCDWEAPKPPKRRARPHAAVQQCAAHDDAIHPNDEGYRNIALMVQRAMDGKDVC